MDLYRALTTIADDPAANAKIKIGVAALSAPWAGIAAVGYQVALARRVAAGQDAYLPDWDDPASLVRLGFWLALARLLYELPARMLVLATLLLALRPLWAAARAAQSWWPGPAREGLSTLLAGALIVLAYNLAYGFLSPAITAQFVRRGTLRSAFDLRGMLRLIARQPGAYAQVWLAREATGVALRLLGLGAGLVLNLLPVVGTLAGVLSWSWLLFVSLLLNGCLVGQLLQLDARQLTLSSTPTARRPLPAREA